MWMVNLFTPNQQYMVPADVKDLHVYTHVHTSTYLEACEPWSRKLTRHIIVMLFWCCVQEPTKCAHILQIENRVDEAGIRGAVQVDGAGTRGAYSGPGHGISSE